MTTFAQEVNFDGLVGPTHNYAGLSEGNLASQQHHHEISNPKAAARQGLEKMKLIADLGVRQAVLPPQPRPNMAALRRLGFKGTDTEVLQRAGRDAPDLLAVCTSASCMWTANAATVSPSTDTADGRMHLTVANLISNLHRSVEVEVTARILQRVFADETMFTCHGPLAAAANLADEGAANHMRLCGQYHEPGLEIFVYGENTKIYPARQRLVASQTIARLHQLDPNRTFFVAQNPRAIDAGVFHNDVISVANQHVLLFHRNAFADDRTIEQLRLDFESQCGEPLVAIEVTRDQLSLEDSVATYLFNSQLVTLPDDTMALICPTECAEHRSARETLASIVADDNPIRKVCHADTRESMKNGGGPACLRLRVVLNQEQIEAVPRGVIFDEKLYGRLTEWVDAYYRDSLAPSDLADPKLLDESNRALDALTQILGIGSVYSFQQ